MSDDDDFGDFAEAEIPQVAFEVQLDALGRPLSLLPSIEWVISDLTPAISQLCEPPDFTFISPSPLASSISQSSNLDNTLSNYNDLVSEYKNYLSNPNENGSIQTPGLGELLIKQGEIFCREIWPSLSIRNIFFKHCSINETSNNAFETLPVVTEMDSDPLKAFAETKKNCAKDFLGYDLPDLSFMLASNIQWPPEYLKQI